MAHQAGATLSRVSDGGEVQLTRPGLEPRRLLDPESSGLTTIGPRHLITAVCALLGPKLAFGNS